MEDEGGVLLRGTRVVSHNFGRVGSQFGLLNAVISKTAQTPTQYN